LEIASKRVAERPKAAVDLFSEKWLVRVKIAPHTGILTALPGKDECHAFASERRRIGKNPFASEPVEVFDRGELSGHDKSATREVVPAKLKSIGSVFKIWGLSTL
jgi:hypothetical protein